MAGKSINPMINLWGQSTVPCTQPLTNTHLKIFYHGKHRLKKLCLQNDPNYGNVTGLSLVVRFYFLLHIYDLIYHIIMGFPYGSVGKESACNVEDLGLIPGLGRSPGEGKGYPLQYSGLENTMDCLVHGVAESYMTE